MPDSTQPSTLIPYRGRFAPSPTGPLHAGSIMAALASYLDAKSKQGLWFVRIEDLDPPRETPESAEEILSTLDELGLHWDGEVSYQSKRHAAYEAALEQLKDAQHLYSCTCTRQQLAASKGRYPGTCRKLNLAFDIGKACRCKVYQHSISFEDELQGRITQQLDTEVGDFIVKRKDGLFAYQLAVVVDDGWQQITHIVRGVDLLDSSPRQIYLQHLLALPTPSYMHIPILVDAQQQKLSKQAFAAAIDYSSASKTLVQALQYLQQQPDPALLSAHKEDVLAWAVKNWQPERLKGKLQISEIAALTTPAV